MVVVTQHLSGVVQHFARRIEPVGERLHFGERVELDPGGPGVGGEVAAEVFEVFDDALRFVEDRVAILVRGATVEAFAFEQATNSLSPIGPSPLSWTASIADGADFFQCLRDLGRRFGEIADGVQLCGDLFDFHRLKEPARSSVTVAVACAAHLS